MQYTIDLRLKHRPQIHIGMSGGQPLHEVERIGHAVCIQPGVSSRRGEGLFDSFLDSRVALQAALADQSQNGNDIMSKIAIGISSGVALSGSVEAPPDKVHTYIGESFKTAYSLNVLAGPGEIIMSKDVFQAVEDLVTVEPVPPREMMDKTEAWENFRLKGLLPKEDDETPSP